MVPNSSSALPHSEVRQQLQQGLLSAVKQCQIRFGGRTELATELDQHVTVLCMQFEAVLSHGLRSKFLLKKNNSAIKQVTERVLGVSGTENLHFWHFVREHLTKHERERYENLRHIWTDNGCGRAWLRSALNERSLERYLLSLIGSSVEQISCYYEDWAFLLDQEKSNILPQAAAGLCSILFAISIDKPELNTGGGGVTHSVPQEPVIQAPTSVPGVKKKHGGRRRKHVTTNIISFEGDNEGDEALQYDESRLDLSAQHPACDLNPVSEVLVMVGVECVEPKDADCSGSSDTGINIDSDVGDIENSGALRPVSNASVGELIPVPLTEETQTSEDSVSVPSFTEEADCSSVSGNSVEAGEVCTEATGGKEESLINEMEKLKKELEEAKETSQNLRTQLAQTAKVQQDHINTIENRVRELNRENEVLKHQLRKYVGAVQMLKQEGQSQEADLYEKKLVQVAEMHGELMELNDRLQRSLLNKESTIKRLRAELEMLRGPLPDSDDDSISPALVNLWIPSVFLAGRPHSPHHVYQVHIRICDEEWNVYRRYAQFYVLHQNLKKQYPVIATFLFPPKKTIGNKDAKFVEERRQKLQQYLRRVMNQLIEAHSALTAAPSKPLLISLFPFFGEQSTTEERHRSSPCNPFSQALPDSPQYTGL